MNPAVQDSRADQPVERLAGIHAARERRWGWIGGTAGALAGVGSAFAAVLLDGASWFEAGPYPSVFRQPRLLALDVYLASMLAAGLAFSLIGLFHVRRSPYPRSDAYGAGLVGTILGVLAGAILLLRVVALTRGG
jgi:hypothetical protein